MHWRFADKIVGFEPWLSIAGGKAISLEEYSLYEPLVIHPEEDEARACYVVSVTNSG